MRVRGQRNLRRQELEMGRTQECINLLEKKEAELGNAAKDASERKVLLRGLKQELAEANMELSTKFAEELSKSAKLENDWLNTLMDAERLLCEDQQPKEPYVACSHVHEEELKESEEQSAKADNCSPAFQLYPSNNLRVEQVRQLKGGSVFKQEQKNAISKSGSPPPEAFVNRFYGLVNLGNTCYMNALLQGLYSCKSFRDTVLQTQHWRNATAGTDCNLSSEIARNLLQLQAAVQDPNEVFNAICSIESCRHFADKSQQDCCELLMKIQDYWSETNRKMFNLFEGGTKYTVGCLDCQDKRDTWDPFTTLSLTLEEKSAYKNGTASLENLIHGLLANEELLDEDNKVQCRKCNTRTTSYKKSQLTNSPQILAIQIKRFEWEDPIGQKEEELEEGKKIKTQVNFTEELHLPGESMDGDRTHTVQIEGVD